MIRRLINRLKYRVKVEVGSDINSVEIYVFRWGSLVGHRGAYRGSTEPRESFLARVQAEGTGLVTTRMAQEVQHKYERREASRIEKNIEREIRENL